MLPCHLCRSVACYFVFLILRCYMTAQAIQMESPKACSKMQVLGISVNSLERNSHKMKKTVNLNTEYSWTADLAYIALAVALMAVCSWISIPTTIPFTLQTFAVMAVCMLLGGKRGTYAVLLYLLLGAIGVPVFSGPAGGLAKLMGPTGGYIIGFVFSAVFMWGFEISFGKKVWQYAISMVLALAICYAFGTLWFMRVYTPADGGHVGLAAALSMCVVPYLIPDALKIVLALLVGSNKALHRVIKPVASSGP